VIVILRLLLPDKKFKWSVILLERPRTPWGGPSEIHSLEAQPWFSAPALDLAPSRRRSTGSFEQLRELLLNLESLIVWLPVGGQLFWGYSQIVLLCANRGRCSSASSLSPR
jgi:hypothetical protein